MRFTYLLVNFFSVIVPFIFSFHHKIKFNQFFRPYFAANLISAFCFIAWDVFFTAKGVWGFNEKYILGYRIFNLPVEECMFFFCIPFACVFTYYCLTLFYKFSWKTIIENIFIIFLSVSLFIIGIINFHRSYTSSTFISTSVLLLACKFIFQVKWMDKFFTIYPVLLIPFFIVNGILTGSGIEQPVVWYNNDENLGIRLFTIPVEDVFYGMELMILTILFYEKLKNVRPGLA